MPTDSDQGSGTGIQRAYLHGSKQWCVTDIWTTFKYFLVWCSAAPYYDINLGPRSPSNCQLTRLQHMVTALYILLCMYGVKEISVSCRVVRYCTQSHTPGGSNTEGLYITKAAWFFLFSLFRYAWMNKTERCFWKENRFATLLWSRSWWEMHSLLLSSLHCPYLAFEYWRCWKVWNPSQWA